MKVPQDSALLTARQDIVDLFRRRIAAGNRTKLERRERQALAKIFLDRLIQMAADRTDSCEAIERLCLDEISLLEEGYPKNTLQSSYLPEYVRLLKAAIAREGLPLTVQNSYQEQANGNGAARRHYALDYLSYNDQARRRQWNSLIVDDEPSVSVVPPPLLSEDKCLGIIEDLFLSSDPMALIVGIAVATGRDPSAVMTLGQLATTPEGGFNQLNLQDHAYRLRCSASGSDQSHDILTIAPAVDVLAAIHKLRSYDLVGIEESALEVRVHDLFAKVSGIQLESGTETMVLLQASYGEIVKTWVAESPDHQTPQLGERAQEQSADCPETAESVLTRSDLRALITTLQSTTKQQAQTIARLTGDLSRLHKELDVAKRAQSNAEAYRSKLEMIYSVFNDGLLSSGSRRKCQGQRLAGQPLTVFHRAIRIWELTQQWNREKSYTREAAIQLSKSLLTRRFGIHAKAIEQFWEHFSAEMSDENERLGIVPGDIHFNRGEKQDIFVAHVKSTLEQEGFLS